MGSPENSGWFLDCALIDEFLTTEGDFAAACVETESTLVNTNGPKESGCCKSVRTESCGGPMSKACREKIRRDKLNERFLELGSILDYGKARKFDKISILSDAARMVTQLRKEAQKLKDLNENLEETIKELKAEKTDLRNEKQMLKAEKDALEQQMNLLRAQHTYIPQPPFIPTAFSAQGQAAGKKLAMPIIGYPSFPMWQLMPPADIDTSQDEEKCPPVA
ncbi:transcription factor ILR3-like [Typha latifolia]|uniref:transcription factor ILR3-like n=1 Tax=Typha latifolia TaxID=4733 RepID=UPI003C2AFA39